MLFRSLEDGELSPSRFDSEAHAGGKPVFRAIAEHFDTHGAIKAAYATDLRDPKVARKVTRRFRGRSFLPFGLI